jgi:hypothetical protein
MALRPLQPAIDGGITGDKLLYEWDEWKVMSYWAFVDDDFGAKISLVSGRGALALMLAVGEWICQRFSLLDADRRPMQFLEAGWAEQMQPGLGAYTDPEDDEWRGIVRGPLLLTIKIANDGLFCLEEDNEPGHRPAWMSNLARRVLPGQDAFEKWLGTVLDLLAKHHPKAGSEKESLPDDQFDLGRPVPRELFDTTKPYQPADEAQLITGFLQTVDPKNPYLSANEPEPA